MPVVPKLHGNLNDDPHPDGEQACAANLGHDLLQVGYIVGGTNQGRSPPKEGVGPCGIHNSVLLSLLDCGAREADVSRVLLHRKGLSCQCRLVNLQ